MNNSRQSVTFVVNEDGRPALMIPDGFGNMLATLLDPSVVEDLLIECDCMEAEVDVDGGISLPLPWP